MDHAAILQVLAEGILTLEGQFVCGSNYTFLGQVETESRLLKVVYKPTQGEIPLWDFPVHTLAKREVAAYLTSQFLGWELVPPTLYRKKNLPLGPGMVQYYIDHDPHYHYFNFSEIDRARQDKVVVFDLLINNADRKGSHVLIGQDDHLWCIDHGVCFHIEDKLRTVIWDFAGQAIAEDILQDLTSFIQQADQINESFKPYLRKSEMNALLRRAKALVEQKIYRIPGDERRMFPYPPV